MKLADMPASSEDFCGTTYAAKLLGLSVGTVQTLVEKSELRAWKTRGGHRRIAMQSVLDYQRRHNPAAASAAGTSKPRLKVLVVEDDAVSRDMMKAHFERWDLPIDCTAMASALDALMDITSLQPDVLITDLRMPGVDGFELLRSVRGNPALAGMNMLAVTGLSPEEIEARGGLPERTVYVRKPVDMRWLNGYFVALLSARSAAQAASS